ncbi:hypothetical protein D3C78_1392580 [compost metagenome]
MLFLDLIQLLLRIVDRLAARAAAAEQASLQLVAHYRFCILLPAVSSRSRIVIYAFIRTAVVRISSSIMRIDPLRGLDCLVQIAIFSSKAL